MFRLKRRREKKTNYKRRLALLKSGKPRLVVRKTNTQIIAQVVEYNVSGDKVIIEARGNDIKNAGWKASTKNLPAAYLTGLAVAKKAKENNVDEMILDIGLQTSTSENWIYALVKGVSDNGINIPFGEEMVPSEDRIKGKHIADYAKESSGDFSNYGIDPENIEEHFEEIKNKLMVNNDE